VLQYNVPNPAAGSQVTAGKFNDLAFKGMNLGHTGAEKVNVI
jgi:hypothetical protein